MFREIYGSFSEKLDEIQLKYGTVWAPRHGNQSGGNFTHCKFDEDKRIIRLRGLYSSLEGGLESLEFITEDFEICKLGNGNPTSFDISHEGYYLSYVSGTLGWNLTNTYMRTLSFNWKKKLKSIFDLIECKNTIDFRLHKNN